MSVSVRRAMPEMLRTAIAIAIPLALGACMTRDLAPLTPCTTSGVQLQVQQAATDKVDLLFLIDDSGSMEVEQRRLADQIERLVTLLTTGDRDGDGAQDFTPVADLQVAMVSSDMGTGGVAAPTCNDAVDFGDDGIARTAGASGDATCAPSYAPVQRYNVRDPDANPTRFAHDVACVARLGTSGCAFEHQLESVLKAVTPSGSAIRFHADTVGQGDRANVGFVREDSILAVVVLSDEDDCSAADPELFREGAGPYDGYPPNQRCAFYDGALHPVARYVDGLRALRADQPERLLFAAIVGVPPDLVADPAHVNYDALLADPRMQPRPLAGTNELEAVCRDPAGGTQSAAYPARRIVGVARGLGEAGVVQSICQSDYRPALDALVRKIASVIDAVCLPRALAPNSEGRVACDVVEVLPTSGDATRCAELADRGREAVPLRIEAGHEVCRVTQAPRETAGTAIGWYYDDFSDVTVGKCGTQGRRIAFTAGAEPVRGALVRLECLQSSAASGTGVPLGTPCTDACPTGLFCDPSSRTCQRACTSDADCGPLTCNPSGFCISPTCGGTELTN